jgi:predicted aldo/keto reductase-like oxidoreductase
MVTVDQVLDNMALIDNFRPLSDAERQVIEQARQALDDIPQYPCTDCRYCVEGCPKNIGIPAVLRALNDYLIYQNLHRFKLSYNGVYETESTFTGQASACVGCGQCEKACPQSLHIVEGLAQATKLYETGEL